MSESSGIGAIFFFALRDQPMSAMKKEKCVYVRVVWRQCDTRDTVDTDHIQAQRTRTQIPKNWRKNVRPAGQGTRTGEAQGLTSQPRVYSSSERERTCNSASARPKISCQSTRLVNENKMKREKRNSRERSGIISLSYCF